MVNGNDYCFYIFVHIFGSFFIWFLKSRISWNLDYNWYYLVNYWHLYCVSRGEWRWRCFIPYSLGWWLAHRLCCGRGHPLPHRTSQLNFHWCQRNCLEMIPQLGVKGVCLCILLKISIYKGGLVLNCLVYILGIGFNISIVRCLLLLFPAILFILFSFRRNWVWWFLTYYV